MVGMSNWQNYINWDGSFEYPQHMFWLKNKKINFLVRTLNYRPGSAPLKASSKDYCLIMSFCIFATTHPKVLITVGNSCPSTQSCLPFSSFNQHKPAIQLLSSSPPTINIVPAYFTIPAPHRALGSSGPGDQVLASGSNISTELTQNSGRYSFFHLSLIAPLPPGKNNPFQTNGISNKATYNTVRMVHSLFWGVTGHNFAKCIAFLSLNLFFSKSKWVWSGNTSITHCRPTHGTQRRGSRTFIVSIHV